jgi:hypothetical protein
MKTLKKALSNIKGHAFKLRKIWQIFMAVMLIHNFCVQAQSGGEMEYLSIFIQEKQDSVHFHIIWEGNHPGSGTIRLPFRFQYDPSKVDPNFGYRIWGQNEWEIDPKSLIVDPTSNTVSGFLEGSLEELYEQALLGGVSIVIVADLIRDDFFPAMIRRVLEPRIGPNPVESGQGIKIEVPAGWKGEWTLMDGNGRFLAQKKGVDGPHTYMVPTRTLPKGMYFLKLVSKNGTAKVHKLIVQ